MTRIVRTIILHEFDDGTWDVTSHGYPAHADERSQYLTPSQAYEQVSNMIEPDEVKGP